MYTKQKKEIEEKFNQTKVKLDEVNLQVRQLSEELMRIQGEHRLILKLEIDENNKPKTECENNKRRGV